jgi:hypothetical protein
MLLLLGGMYNTRTVPNFLSNEIPLSIAVGATLSGIWWYFAHLKCLYLYQSVWHTNPEDLNPRRIDQGWPSRKVFVMLRHVNGFGNRI